MSYLWFFFPADYVLIANQDSRLFLTSPGYFYSFLERPGGIIEYAGIFINQFLRFRIPGALILSVITGLSYSATCRLSEKASVNKPVHIIGIITPILLMGILNYYPEKIYHALGLIIIMFAVITIPENRVKQRMALVAYVPLIYIVCGAYLWIFIALFLAVQLHRNGRVDFKMIILTAGYAFLLIILASGFVYLYPAKVLLIHPLPDTMELLLYLFVLWILLSPGLMKAYMKWKFLETRWAFAPGAILCFASLFLVLNYTYDRKNKDLYRIEKLAVDKEWDKLLHYSSQHPPTTLFGSYYTNMALAKKGLLCFDLFNYPTHFGKQGLFIEWAYKEQILKRGSDYFWTINFVNETHHWAFESFVSTGFTKKNLIRLIQTELIRGNHKVAEKYIRVLEQTLFDRKLAADYRKFLYDRNAIEKDPELGPRIKTQISSDFFSKGIDQEKNLKLLLVNDPLNRQAFEYLMAQFLLEKRLDDIVQVLPYYLKLTGGKIPPLLEECLLVYYASHNSGAFSRIRISGETRTRYIEYKNSYRRYSNKKDAEHALYPSYGNTFWFYMDFGSFLKSKS